MNDRDWRSWWNTVPAGLPETEFFRQVARTEYGKPTDEADIRSSVTAVVETLSLTGEQIVVDLCCGNGLITQQIARHCRKLFGIDYSSTLLAIARRYHGAPNVTYVESPAEAIMASTFDGTPIDKAYMCVSIQYFDAMTFARLLQKLRALSSSGFQLLLDDIPDQARLAAFYNTPELWQEYETRKANGTEAIGHWWRRDELIKIANRHGYRCETIEQAPHRRRSHYRFDALLTL